MLNTWIAGEGQFPDTYLIPQPPSIVQEYDLKKLKAQEVANSNKRAREKEGDEKITDVKAKRVATDENGENI